MKSLNLKSQKTNLASITWIVSCIVFLLAVMYTSSQYDSIAVSVAGISTIIGVISFILVLVFLFQRYKSEKEFTLSRLLTRLLILLGSCLVFIMSISSFVGLKNDYENEQIKPDNYIDCYIDGKLIKATREDCKDLSISNNIDSKEIPTTESINPTTNISSTIEPTENSPSANTVDNLIKVDVPNDSKDAYCEKNYAAEIVENITKYDQLKEKIDDLIEEDYKENKYSEIEDKINELEVYGSKIDVLLKAHCYVLKD